MGASTNHKKRSRAEGEVDAVAVGGSITNSGPSSKKPRVEERRSIFVRSLPAEATNESLTEFFSEYFPVKHATVITDQKTKESRGYGFVTFTDAEDASQAKLALDKKLWNGKNIRVDIAEPRQRKNPGEKAAPIPGKPATKDELQKLPKLIVRNLPWSIKTSEQLSHLFRSFGKVKFADLPQSKGKLKGFGFVTLRGKKNAEKALESLNGKEVDGRTIAIDWAVDKQTWEGQQQTEEVKENAEEDDETSDDATSDDGTADEDENDKSEILNGDQPKSETAQLDADLENFFKNHMQNMEDEDEDDEDDEDKKDAGKPEPPKKQTTDNSSTVFIRNLPFTTTDEQLKGFFSHFGKVRYARVVMDKTTEKPAGTGFVCFVEQADAKACVTEAPRPQEPAASKGTKHSILQDENADPDGKYTLDGRLLQVAQAVSKETATNLSDSSLAKRREKDKRRLFLLSEGHIGPSSPLFNVLSQPELQMRQASAAQRKKLVQNNPSLHLSLTRLSLRNIPRNIGSKELKELARKAVVGFATDVKEGRRQPISKEENARDGKDGKEREHQRKLKGKGIVRQAKIVFESNQGSKVPEASGAGKSRGYGFIEYSSHRSALMGLRYLNGHQLVGDNGRKQRLIAEFSIENAQVVQRRRAVESKSGEQPVTKKTGPADKSGDERATRILKTNKESRGKGRKKPYQLKAEANAEAEKEDASNEGAGIKQTLIARKRLMRKKKAKARG
jgi:nucleolar protein 4